MYKGGCLVFMVFVVSLHLLNFVMNIVYIVSSLLGFIFFSICLRELWLKESSLTTRNASLISFYPPAEHPMFVCSFIEKILCLVSSLTSFPILPERERRKRLVNPFFQLGLSRLSLILALRRSHVLFINAHTICCLTILTLYDSFWYVTYYSFTTLKVLHLGAQIYTWVFCNILSWLKFMNKSV